MFLIVPLLLIIGSFAGIALIIWRKKSYFKEFVIIENGVSEVSVGFNFSLNQYWREFFPEIEELVKRIKFDEYKVLWLLELEKFLRKTRLIFLRVDSWSDQLIKKVRRIHLNGKLNSNEVSQEVISGESVVPSPIDQVQSQTISSVFLKNEEERLILEIAKNPKDSALYEALGDLYMEMQNWADAKESYEASIELSPQNESLKQKLSLALEKLVQK